MTVTGHCAAMLCGTAGGMVRRRAQKGQTVLAYSAVRTAAMATVAILAAAMPAAGQTPTLAMLDGLERGQWLLRDRDDASSTRSYCVTDWRQLLQLQHQRSQCTRTVLENSATTVRVHYSCGSAGHGQTTIRRETNRLIQLETQGIAGGAPFSLAYEGRRTGACN